MVDLSTDAKSVENVVLKGLSQANIAAKRVDAEGDRLVQADVSAVETSAKSHVLWYALGAVIVIGVIVAVLVL